MTEQSQAAADYVLYEYTPSLPGNATMLAAFTILTGYHIALYCLRRQNVYIPLIVGGLSKLMLNSNLMHPLTFTP